MDFLTLENIGKLVVALVSAFSMYKVFLGLVSKKKELLQADYEFAEKFIANGKWENLHDYLLERGYWGLSGKQLDASVIRYFLRLKDPLGQLTDYTRGLRFLSPLCDDQGNVFSIEYKGKLNDPSKYKWKSCRIMVRYYVFASLSLIPVMFLSYFLSLGFTGIAWLVAWVISFGMLTYADLNEIWALQSAKRIIDKTSNNRSGKSLVSEVS